MSSCLIDHNVPDSPRLRGGDVPIGMRGPVGRADVLDRRPLDPHGKVQVGTRVCSVSPPVLQPEGEPWHQGTSDMSILKGQHSGVESIIRKVGRPVLLVRGNSYGPGGLQDDLCRLLQASRSRLDPVIPAVGRVEVYYHPDRLWVGTAWLVARDVVATNRHIAEEFAGTGGGYKPRLGVGNRPILAAVDFAVEHDARQPTKALFLVQDVIHIEPDGGPDLALLRIDSRVARSPLICPGRSSSQMPSLDQARPSSRSATPPTTHGFQTPLSWISSTRAFTTSSASPLARSFELIRSKASCNTTVPLLAAAPARS